MKGKRKPARKRKVRSELAQQQGRRKRYRVKTGPESCGYTRWKRT